MAVFARASLVFAPLLISSDSVRVRIPVVNDIVPWQTPCDGAFTSTTWALWPTLQSKFKEQLKDPMNLPTMKPVKFSVPGFPGCQPTFTFQPKDLKLIGLGDAELESVECSESHCVNGFLAYCNDWATTLRTHMKFGEKLVLDGRADFNFSGCGSFSGESSAIHLEFVEPTLLVRPTVGMTMLPTPGLGDIHYAHVELDWLQTTNYRCGLKNLPYLGGLVDTVCEHLSYNIAGAIKPAVTSAINMVVSSAASKGSAFDSFQCSLSDQDCSWTKEYACPGQPSGTQGYADIDDASDGFHCCCKQRYWVNWQCKDVDCTWTKSNRCPGQQLGNDTVPIADDDGSVGYNCCCKEDFWKTL